MATTDAVNKAYVDGQNAVEWFGALTNKSGSYTSTTTATFSSKNIHDSFHSTGTASNKSQWLLFINGQAIELESITSIVDSSANILVTVDTAELGFSLESGDELSLWGPMS